MHSASAAEPDFRNPRERCDDVSGKEVQAFKLRVKKEASEAARDGEGPQEEEGEEEIRAAGRSRVKSAW